VLLTNPGVSIGLSGRASPQKVEGKSETFGF